MTGTSTFPLTLRFNKNVVIGHFVFGGVYLLMGVVQLGSFASFVPTLLLFGTALLMFGTGLGGLLRPIIAKVNRHELVIYNLFGMIIKVYKFTDLSALKLENDKIYAQQGESRKSVSIVRWLIDDNDWKRLEAILKSYNTKQLG
jgi:hypothetical protein